MRKTLNELHENINAKRIDMKNEITNINNVDATNESELLDEQNNLNKLQKSQKFNQKNTEKNIIADDKKKFDDQTLFTQQNDFSIRDKNKSNSKSHNKQFWELESKIGYYFNNEDLLTQALLHPSVNGIHFEFLEFLGDRVLALSIAKILVLKTHLGPDCDFHKNMNTDVKFVASKHAKLVSTECLLNIAKIWQIDKYLQHKIQQLSHKVFADSVEAILGAIYNDSNFETVFEIIKKFWEPLMDIESLEPKTELQEISQSLALGTPVYEVISTAGKEHSKTFEVRVSVGQLGSATGSGSSKHMASKNAAINFLHQYKKSKTVNSFSGKNSWSKK